MLNRRDCKKKRFVFWHICFSWKFQIEVESNVAASYRKQAWCKFSPRSRYTAFIRYWLGTNWVLLLTNIRASHKRMFYKSPNVIVKRLLFQDFPHIWSFSQPKAKYNFFRRSPLSSISTSLCPEFSLFCFRLSLQHFICLLCLFFTFHCQLISDMLTFYLFDMSKVSHRFFLCFPHYIRIRHQVYCKTLGK